MENTELYDLGMGGLKVLQEKGGFRFGIDSIILSHFAGKDAKGSVLDLCTGSGVIPIVLSQNPRVDSLMGIEVMESVARMAEESVLLNGLSDRISIVHADINTLDRPGLKRRFNMVTVNPPYKKMGTGHTNSDYKKQIARHEVLCTLDDVVRIASICLADGGKLSMIHKPERFTDIVECMRKYQIEPKRTRIVYPNAKSEANLVCVSGTLFGGQALRIEKPLIIYDEDGNYTEDMMKIYHEECR